jgi:hypothetical protein
MKYLFLWYFRYLTCFFVLFVFVLCLVYPILPLDIFGLSIFYCPFGFLLTFISYLSGKKTQDEDKQNKYTTQYVLDTTIHKTQDEDKQNKIHNTICVRHHHTQDTKHILCCVFCFVCLRLVSCVWWCLTHIVLCILFCLSSSCVLCMLVFNKYCVVYFAQDEDKQNKIHNTIFVRHQHTQDTRRRQTKQNTQHNIC